MVMVCMTVAGFPQSSVYVHVRIIVSGSPLGPVSVPVTVPPGLQLSVYAKSTIGGTWLIQLTEISIGGSVKTGAVLSTVLVMSCVTEMLLLQASVTVNVLVVVSVHPTRTVTSPAKATTGKLQLSAASITTDTSGAGTGVLHSATIIGEGLDAVGKTSSSTNI